MPATRELPQSSEQEAIKPLLICVETLAEMLDISPRSIWRRLSSGEMIEPVRIGSSVRWRLQDVEAWVGAGCPTPMSNGMGGSPWHRSTSKGRDNKKKHAPWYIDYLDHAGKRQTVKGFTDKSKTEQLAAKLEREAHLRRTGMIDPEQEELAKRKRSDIEDHLQEFEKSLMRRKNTAKHVQLTMGRVRRVVEGCEFKTLGDINAEAVECFLGELREEEDLGHRTYNHYVQAFEQFCTWLTKKGRLASNPVVGLPRLNCDTDPRHNRRALTTDEFAMLVQSALESTETIQCYDGNTRAKIYILSYMTGLRRGELAGLTPDHFNLGGTLETVTIPATISKHRKNDTLPLHPELVLMLRDWFSGLEPNEYLFPRLARRRTWLMVKKDLERVGIPYKTSDGYADFHAAGRHTHITELFRSGASISGGHETGPSFRCQNDHAVHPHRHQGSGPGVGRLAESLSAHCQHCGRLWLSTGVASCRRTAR